MQVTTLVSLARHSSGWRQGMGLCEESELPHPLPPPTGRSDQRNQQVTVAINTAKAKAAALCTQAEKWEQSMYTEDLVIQ